MSCSKLKNILQENPALKDRTLPEGALLSYKGRKYGWLTLKNSSIYLSGNLMQNLKIKTGDKLLAIRSSNIAFTMGVRGTLIDKSNSYIGEIKIY
ncbi:hypothetical protein [Treponema phagedenis]|uniref:hypothetical protein n=1 Tax=Treponema phagedenis TaxID=162 RepID=UPI000310F58B|nr:hypothetical protein [Treponema phagedenis]